MKKIIITSLSFIVIIGIAISVYLYKTSASDFFDYSGSISADTSADIVITRDRRGVPAIKVTDPSDIYYALGLVHAQDRLPEMEYYRTVAKGNGDSVIRGDEGKILSKMAFAMDFYGKADELLLNLKEPYKSHIEKYIKGINDARSRISYRKIMRSPEDDTPWTSRDCLAIYVLLEWTSSFLSNYELLLPIDSKKNHPALEDLIPKGVISVYSYKEADQIAGVKKIHSAIKNNVSSPGKGYALYTLKSFNRESSALVRYSADSDIFPLYYPVSVINKDTTAYAVSFAGLPFFNSVVSEKFSFSIFDASIDAMDFYFIPVIKKDNDEMYASEFDIKKFSNINLPPKYSGEKIRRTDYGPVISDIVSQKNDTSCVVLDKISIDEKNIVSRFNISLSNNINSALNAIASDTGYPKAVMLASGRDALKSMMGSIPVRSIRNNFFKNSFYAKRYLNLSYHKAYPKGELLYVSGIIHENDFNDLNEFIVYKYDEQYKLLKDLTVTDLTKIKMTEFVETNESKALSEFALQTMKLLENVPVTSAKLSRVYLSDWKGDFSADTIAPTIAYQIIFSMVSEVLNDDIGNDVSGILENPTLVYEKLPEFLDNGNSPIIDNTKTIEEIETIDKAFNSAFLKGMRVLHRSYGPEMGKWRWGRVANTEFRIPYVKKSSVFSGPSKSCYTEDAKYNGCVTYSAEKGMTFIPNSSVSILMAETTYWSTNFALSSNPRSQYYCTEISSSRLNPFDVRDTLYTFTIIPKNK
jgi:penicillin G amidase